MSNLKIYIMIKINNLKYPSDINNIIDKTNEIIFILNNSNVFNKDYNIVNSIITKLYHYPDMSFTVDEKNYIYDKLKK